MKRKLQLKSILLTAMLCVGMSAWGSSFPNTLTIYTDGCSSTSTYTEKGKTGGVYSKSGEGYGTSTNCLQVSRTGYFDLKSVNTSLPDNLTNTILTFYMKPKASGAGYISVYPSSVSPGSDSSNELLKLAITSAAGSDDGEATVSINGSAYGTTLTGNVYYKVEIDMALGTYSIVNTSTSATFASGSLANYTSLSDTQLGGIFIKNPLDTRIDEISVKCDYTWTGVTPFSESYNSESTTTGWSTATSGRYTPTLLSEGEEPSTNYYMSVSQDQRNNNGTTITGNILNGKAIAGADFTLTFDLKLVSSNDQYSTSFTIKDAANSGTIFSLTAMWRSTTEWTLNGTSHHVTLPGSSNNPAISSITWCSCQVTRSNGYTWIKIINKSSDEVIFAQAPIKSSATGGLGNIVFATSRYYSNFAIDNIVVRDIEDGDIEDEKAVYTYDVNAVAGGTTLQTLGSCVGVQGSIASVTLPKVITYNDKYYVLDDDDNAALTGYKASYTIATSNETKEINYSLDESIVYFREGETIASSVIVDDEASGGMYAYYKKGVSSIGITNAGIYRLETDVKDRANSNPLDVYTKSEDVYSSIGEIAKNGGTGERYTGSFELPENSTIYVGLDGNNNSLSFDYIIIRQIKEVTTTAAGFGWATLFTDKALDFSKVDGLTAYTATVAGSTVTLTPVDNVPANTGVVLKSTTTNADVVNNIPVIASSTTPQGSLDGSVTAALAYDANDTYNYYMLKLNGSNEAQFSKLTGGTIAAGKAYLKIAKNNAPAMFNVVFANETTGINNVNRETITNNRYFDLQGRKVANPTKGLYIVNGKKVIIK